MSKFPDGGVDDDNKRRSDRDTGLIMIMLPILGAFLAILLIFICGE